MLKKTVSRGLFYYEKFKVRKLTYFNPKAIFILLSFLFAFVNLTFGHNYPNIPELKSRNFMFAQYQDEVSLARKALKADKETFVNFYSYTAEKGDTILTLSARCSISQESIATLNHISSADTVLQGTNLILPTVPGLYLPLNPQSPIEMLLANEYSVEIANGAVPLFYINGEQFYFLKAAYFSPEERAFFLIPDMAMPLDNYRLTSPYGMRVSPISGMWKFHKGIDMAAKTGTNVMACKNGIISHIGRNDYVYGNYIIIQHEDGVKSLYAHLSYINDSLNIGSIVNKREVIGKVGQTGLATGPHLHFEIIIHGSNEDPEKYINERK